MFDIKTREKNDDGRPRLRIMGSAGAGGRAVTVYYGPSHTAQRLIRRMPQIGALFPRYRLAMGPRSAKLQSAYSMSTQIERCDFGE